MQKNPHILFTREFLFVGHALTAQAARFMKIFIKLLSSILLHILVKMGRKKLNYLIPYIFLTEHPGKARAMALDHSFIINCLT